MSSISMMPFTIVAYLTTPTDHTPKSRVSPTGFHSALGGSQMFSHFNRTQTKLACILGVLYKSFSCCDRVLVFYFR